MNTSIEQKKRQVIPRWRTFYRTACLNELSSSLKKTNQVTLLSNPELIMREKISEWEDNKYLPFAAEVVNTAFLTGQTNLAKEAAKFIISNDKASWLIKDLANAILNSNTNFLQNEEVSAVNIRKYKQRLRQYPKDGITWVELARDYTILGLFEKANKAIDMALRLNTHNRFILRCASRFYYHLGNMEKSYQIIKNANLVEDPWIMATFVSLSDAAGKSLHNIKDCRRMIYSGSYNFNHISELSASIGTIEVNAGDIKEAKKLFKVTLVRPNENSLAQAHSVSDKLGLTLDKAIFQTTPLSYEAKALDLLTRGDYINALNEGNQWLLDQPFSSKPFILCSYLSGLLQQYDRCARYANDGLKSNPNNPNLINNLAFGLANLNKVDEARLLTKDLSIFNSIDTMTKVCLTATKGLIEFRCGNFSEGQSLYLSAINEAKKVNFYRLAAIAQIYYIREMLNANIVIDNEQLQSTLEFCATHQSTEIDFLLDTHILKKLGKK